MSDNIDYQPINCAIHDEFELACIRQEVRTLTWHTKHQTFNQKLRFLDLKCEQGAEYLIAETEEHKPFKIRLDHIINMQVDSA
ncbi:Rho-binding antiterminator [Neptuniibacter sp. 1_MG-2023]|uniref:Rho-binding antiterminator n=1 Tax=Neptuniibacter sp. 1_MG-2023 TaxID=3062662 RepID=UPI0026E2C7C4|nr:Rho-binding antiterminator [Neptuniibacter sp. 1_MG-2023]MDO6593503.1 Rho-binding antiterminator [Neptuniibacter sp. 1_MG-2023]